MSTSKHVDKFCLAAVAVTLVLTILSMFGGSLGLTAAAKTVKYERTLFDTSYVHKIDIVMDDWDAFLSTCENEEYAVCTVVVDGQKHKNIAIRAKGNTSLSNVKSLGSQRYSFKLEFDHYESGKSLDGLDKLCLNNLIQDNTMMKDYLVYLMMRDFGADSPLCSFAYLTVNGEDWGLYLAVEGVEDSFLARNYGSDTGELYKPDSMSFGGGRGNGKDFNMDDFDFGAFGDGQQGGAMPGGFPGGQVPGQSGDGRQGGAMPGGQFPGQSGDGRQGGFPGGQFPSQSGDGRQGGFPGGQFPSQSGDGRQGGAMPGAPGGGMGSDDVKLKYIDDDPDSYSNIFDNAKTDASAADQERLIASLKQLSAYTELEDVLDMEEVLRYFVVHIFVCNGDSYTGSMIHNYYLHEKDGKLGMIPWDYNLAFGTFQGGNASSEVNASIDSLVSGSVDDRPMVGWIFSDEGYTEQYHELFAQFLERWFTNGELETLIADTAELLRPCVEKDPTKFCTTEEFEKGVTALSQFVTLRGEAVRRQLAGDDTAVVTDGLTLSDMGTMGGGGGPGGAPGGFPSGQFPGQPGDFSGGFPSRPDDTDGSTGTTPSAQSGDGAAASSGEAPQTPEQTPQASGDVPDGTQLGDGTSFTPGKMPQNAGQTPQFPGGSSQTPGGASENGGENRPQPPEGFDPTGTAQGGSSELTFWVLLGASVLVLAAGVLIAVKKKY